MKYIHCGKCLIACMLSRYSTWCIIVLTLALGGFSIRHPTLADALATTGAIYPVLEEIRKELTDTQLARSSHEPRKDSLDSSSSKGPRPSSGLLKGRFKVHLDADHATKQLGPETKDSAVKGRVS